MTLSRLDYQVEYEITSAEAERVEFPFGFPAQEAVQIHCLDIDAAGEEVEIPASGFSVVAATGGLANGGVVTLSEPMAVGHILLIERQTPYTQLKVFRNQNHIDPAEVESALDKLSMAGVENEGGGSGDSSDLKQIRQDIANLQTGKADKGAAPATHAPSHAKGGTDPVTPTSIGAIPNPANQAANRILGTDSGGAPAWLTALLLANMLPVGSASQLGLVRADNLTTFISAGGVISAVGGSGGGNSASMTPEIYDPDFGKTQDVINLGFKNSIEVLGASLPGMFLASFTTDGTSIDYTFTHNLNADALIVETVSTGGTPTRARFGVSFPDDNTLILTADPARPAGETYTVIAIGKAASSAGNSPVAASRVYDFAIGSSQSDINQRMTMIFPVAAQIFYIDPAGDDSVGNPGTLASPFKSLRGAYNALCGRQAPSAHPVYLFMNPGTYLKENLHFPASPLSQDHLVITATTPAQPPRLATDSFVIRGLQTVYLRNLDITMDSNFQVLDGATIQIDNPCKFSFAGGNQYLFFANKLGSLMLNAGITVDGGGLAQHSLFYSANHSGIALDAALSMTLGNIPSFNRTALVDNYGNISVQPAATLSFDPAITGRRYEAYYYSYIRLNGKGESFFPGDAAGYVDTGSNALVTL